MMVELHILFVPTEGHESTGTLFLFTITDEHLDTVYKHGWVAWEVLIKAPNLDAYVFHPHSHASVLLATHWSGEVVHIREN